MGAQQELPMAGSENRGDCLIPSPSVQVTENQDGAIALDIVQGLCFSMNPVAFLVWSDLKRGFTTSEIAQHVVNVYQIPIEQASNDVRELLEQLKAHKLLHEHTSIQARPIRFTTARRLLAGFWHRRR